MTSATSVSNDSGSVNSDPRGLNGVVLYESFTNAFQALYLGDYHSIPEKLQFLLRSVYGSENPQFFDFYLLNHLYSTDIGIQMRVLNTFSQIAKSDSEALFYLPYFVKPLLKQQAIIPSVLKCLISVYFNVDFHNIFSDLFDLAIQGTNIVRKLCLHLFYCIYRKDEYFFKELHVLLKRGLFDNELKLSAISIISEICPKHKNEVYPMLPLLLGEFDECDTIMFSKLCRIFMVFSDKKNEITTSLVDIMTKFLKNHKQISYYIDSALLFSRFPWVPSILEEIGKYLDRSLTLIKKVDTVYLIAKTYVQLCGKYTPSQSSLQILLTFPDFLVVSEALKIRNNDAQSTEDVYKIVNDLVVEMAIRPSPHLSVTAMNLVPHQGEWFVTMIFEIYNLHQKSSIDALAQSIRGVVDTETQRYILTESRKQMPELPCDEFGISIAELVSKVSEDPDDFFFLLPSNITYKSEAYQLSMISCVIDFWLRLRFEVSTSMMNRLMLLSFSVHREIRYRTLELISIFNDY